MISFLSPSECQVRRVHFRFVFLEGSCFWKGVWLFLDNLKEVKLKFVIY
jgi:hypothetical protein